MATFKILPTSLLLVIIFITTNVWAFSPIAEPGKEGEPLYSGEVVQVLQVGGYTYLLVAVTDSAQIWAAVPKTDAQIGDFIDVPSGLPMANFHSQTLDREFELIYFVDQIVNHSEPSVANVTSQADNETIQQKIATRITNDEALSLEALFADKDKLEGQTVFVTGVVVKYSAAIMGTNWLHIQDGTLNGTRSYDLTITSDDQVAVGDVVVAEGVVTLNKNIGDGYHFEIIVENAQIRVQN